MTRLKSNLVSVVGTGLVAGLSGAGVMMAMRSFDQRYAPETIPPMRGDPGAFMVKAAKRAVRASGGIPKPVERSAAIAMHAGYGALFGVLYGLWRGRGTPRSALIDGSALGGIAYATAYLGLLPALGLTDPAWKQRFPEIAGESLRRVAFGVATTAVYGAVDA
jgi:hypothetical protein